MLAHSDDAMLEYYRYLNSGYRLPLVGGTDKMSGAVPAGLYRTYARLDEEFSYEAWCRAVRSDRTFLSGGPLVTLSADGCEPGGTVGLSGQGTVSVHAAVRRSDQFTTHHHGEAGHLAWLERPFAEALRALGERGRA